MINVNNNNSLNGIKHNAPAINIATANIFFAASVFNNFCISNTFSPTPYSS